MIYELKVSGMTCQGCINAVRMAVNMVKDVKINEVKIGKVIVDTSPDNIQKIADNINLYGYKVEEIKEVQ